MFVAILLTMVCKLKDLRQDCFSTSIILLQLHTERSLCGSGIVLTRVQQRRLPAGVVMLLFHCPRVGSLEKLAFVLMSRFVSSTTPVSPTLIFRQIFNHNTRRGNAIIIPLCSIILPTRSSKLSSRAYCIRYHSPRRWLYGRRTRCHSRSVKSQMESRTGV
jgi:hypothetical protein